MTRLVATIAMSIDGFTAGPEQSVDDPLGKGGMRLHEWAFALKIFREAHGFGEGGEVTPSTAVVEQQLARQGATIMGRNMFGGRGPWGDDPWPGWWGDEPPYHHPVFVLTHHAREPLVLTGTTFHFVTDGIESALAQATEAAGDRDINLAGGANAIQQYLGAGLVDELRIDLVPTLLGAGERLFEHLAGESLGLLPADAVVGQGVTHLTYRRSSLLA
jgi:dihydrofolate reductase